MAEIYPLAKMAAMREWSETRFKERVQARLEQLGQPKIKPLLIAAGGKGDEIRKDPKRARRMDTIFLIAKALKWTVGQAVGIQDPTLFLDSERELDPAKLALAMQMADEIVGENDPGWESVADLTSSVYSVLSDREAEGLSLDTDEVRSMLGSIFRRFLNK